jgi:hypothetical protein
MNRITKYIGLTAMYLACSYKCIADTNLVINSQSKNIDPWGENIEDIINQVDYSQYIKKKEQQKEEKGFFSFLKRFKLRPKTDFPSIDDWTNLDFDYLEGIEIEGWSFQFKYEF